MSSLNSEGKTIIPFFNFLLLKYYLVLFVQSMEIVKYMRLKHRWQLV